MFKLKMWKYFVRKFRFVSKVWKLEEIWQFKLSKQQVSLISCGFVGWNLVKRWYFKFDVFSILVSLNKLGSKTWEQIVLKVFREKAGTQFELPRALHVFQWTKLSARDMRVFLNRLWSSQHDTKIKDATAHAGRCCRKYKSIKDARARLLCLSTLWAMSNSRELFNLEMWTLLSDRESARISLLSLETHYKITIGNVRIQNALGLQKENKEWQIVALSI